MELFSTKQAAQYLGVSHRTLEGWRLRGGGPRYLRLGARKCVRYRLEDLTQFVGGRLTESTSAEVVS